MLRVRWVVILSAVFIIFFGYLAVGFAGYLAYPTTVDSNVLKSFPTGPILLKVRRPAACCLPACLLSGQHRCGADIGVSGQGPIPAERTLGVRARGA